MAKEQQLALDGAVEANKTEEELIYGEERDSKFARCAGCGEWVLVDSRKDTVKCGFCGRQAKRT